MSLSNIQVFDGQQPPCYAIGRLLVPTAQPLVLQSDKAPYNAESATIDLCANGFFTPVSISGVDTELTPQGVYYGKLSVRPNARNSMPELLFVGQDWTGDGAVGQEQFGVFVRAPPNVGPTEGLTARLGLTNDVENTTLGNSYYFEMPQNASGNPLTFNVKIGAANPITVFSVNQDGSMAVGTLGPIDPTRVGTFTGTGAAQVVPVTTISAVSVVVLGLIAGAGVPAAAPEMGAVAPNVSFTVTAALGAIYSYQVIG